MTDIFTDEIVEAMQEPGCPLCHVLELDERRTMAAFLREGRKAGEQRLRFYEGGGFCRHHAWLFHELAIESKSGAPIADIYGRLLERDLERLRGVQSRNRRRPGVLARSDPCIACAWADAALHRKASFFVTAVRTQTIRRRYTDSAGLCMPHFAAVVDAAFETDSDVRRFLLEDQVGRMERLLYGLAEYDRKRDHRYADEPKGEEQMSWTDVIRRYAGEREQTPLADGVPTR